jgi:hypothetical protein
MYDMCVCMYDMCVCMYVCMYDMCVCMFVCYVCMYVFMYVCVYVCLFVFCALGLGGWRCSLCWGVSLALRLGIAACSIDQSSHL